MEEFCRSAMKKLGDSVVTDIQGINTTVKTYLTAAPEAAGHEFVVGIDVVNASNISFQFLKKDSDQRHIVTSACLSIRQQPASVLFSCRAFSTSNGEENIRTSMMRHVLDNMIMTPSLRRRVMDLALDTARAPIASRPPGHNCIWISIHVGASFKFGWDEMPVFGDEDELCKEIKRYTVTAIDAETCAICLKDFLGEDGSSKYIFTPCGHKFHVDCINGRPRVSGSRRCLSCPICGHNFDSFAVTTS